MEMKSLSCRHVCIGGALNCEVAIATKEMTFVVPVPPLTCRAVEAPDTDPVKSSLITALSKHLKIDLTTALVYMHSLLLRVCRAKTHFCHEDEA